MLKRKPMQQQRSLLSSSSSQSSPPLIYQIAFLDRQASSSLSQPRRHCWRFLLVATLVLLLSWAMPARIQTQAQTQSTGMMNTKTQTVDDPVAMPTESPTLPIEPMTVNIHHERCAEDRPDCTCPDPAVAQPRYDHSNNMLDRQWQQHHNQTYRLPSTTTTTTTAQVIFVGDSIFERWGGTRGGGRPLDKAVSYRNSFQTAFHPSEDTVSSWSTRGHPYRIRHHKTQHLNFESRIWATAGDTTTEVLWHLQELARASGDANNLNNNNNAPRKLVWVLLIGTNDVGRWGCHRETVLQGIQNVARRLETFGRHVLQSPEQHILVHGLLPRADDTDTFVNAKAADNNENDDHHVTWPLGTWWKRDLVWINQQLEHFVKEQQQESSTSTNWKYVDAKSIFLLQDKLRYMPDALHPYVLGYRRWANLLAATLEQVLKD